MDGRPLQDERASAPLPARARGFAPYLPQLVRDWARASPSDTRLELDGSLVSADISGFTALSERLAAKGRAGAEELILLISGCFEGLIGTAERFGGDVLKFRGDALLLLFSGEGHERRAARAAADMQWFIGNAAPANSSVGPVALAMSVGVHSGPCHFYVVGTSHRELLVTGTAATETVRLESAAEAGEILLSARTAAALGADELGEERDGARLLARTPEADEPLHPAAEAEAGPPVDLEPYVPATLRSAIRSASGEGEHRQATVAFLKFSGTDALSAEETLARLDALASTVAKACDELGVTWLESDIDIDGGKLYLTSGAPASSGADEESMLRAVRAILDAGAGPALQAGVNRGPVFAGEIGASSRRTYAVMGDTVNLAARLAARAQPGQILATGAVLDRSGARFEAEAQPFLVKGKERAVTAFAVGSFLGEREEEAAGPLPLIGREAELDILREAVDRARRRIGQTIELVGEPGIGKSRLLEELRTMAVGFAQLEARCGQYAVSAPYFPFRALLRPLAGLTPDDRGEAAGEQLRTWIEAVMPDLAQWLPLLAIPFDVQVAQTPEVEQLDPAFRMQRMHEAIATFLERVLMMPTLPVIEDAHWLDDASLALLRHLVSRPAPRPWLVAVTRRPEGERILEPDAPGGITIELEPLPAQATRTLALAAAGETAVSAAALAELAERSGGNPLFIRELVASAKHTGGGDLPETVETVITARIDRLSPEDRQLLRFASVMGAAFALDILGEAAGGEAGDVRDLERWERLAEFVSWEGEDSLRFKHDLFRAVAYEGLTFRRRREIHERVGQALERRMAGNEESIADLLSLHFLRAERYEDAWRYSVLAGERAHSTYANVVAAQLYRRALDAAEHLPDLAPSEVARVAESLGDVAELAAHYDEAAAAYARSADLIGGEPLAEARLKRKQGVLQENAGHYAEALHWYTGGLEVLGTAPDSESERARLELSCASAHFRQGRFDDCVRWATTAVTHAEAGGDRAALGRAYYLLAIAHTNLGHPETDAYREQALPVLVEVGDLIGQGKLLNNLGIDLYYAGRWDEARQCYEECRDATQSAGDVVTAAIATNNIGEILSDQGSYAEAGNALREALRVWQAAGYAIGAALATSNLGRLASREGRFADGRALLSDALAAFEEIGAGSFVVETLARVAECHVLAGEYQEARQVLEDALARSAEGAAKAQVLPLLHRVHGYALMQAREPRSAQEPLARSLEHARGLGAAYEIALTLQAVAALEERTGSRAQAEEARAESNGILDRLGVVATPLVPLP